MKNTQTFQHFISAFLLIGSFALLGIFTAPKTTSATFLEGGRSESADFCSCSICFKIEVGSPKDGTFMWCPWYTRLYAYYNIFPNAWQLGKSYPYCEEDDGGYLLEMTGTSMGS